MEDCLVHLIPNTQRRAQRGTGHAVISTPGGCESLNAKVIELLDGESGPNFYAALRVSNTATARQDGRNTYCNVKTL